MERIRRSANTFPQLKPGFLPDQRCRFVSSRGHVKELQKISAIDRRLTVEAIYEFH
jgi:hypothetical protein